MLGMSSGSKLLIVCHCERKQGAVIRIISARKNPYASRLKKPVTMRLSEDVVEHFKAMADEAGVPYQSLINLYLRDCLANSRKVHIKWPSTV
jgi:uncharacterized protein (DUF4415 family)